MTLLEQARAFREAYGQEMLEGMVRYGFVKEKLFRMQAALIAEESAEFLQAARELEEHPNSIAKHTEVLKELSDLVFVAYQFAAAFGLDLDTAMDRVFESNMSKLGDDGKPIYREDGKVLKGPNYKKPTLDDLVPTTNLQYDTSGK
jgi:predicted HAD superfamily Cof-like phosphohydrolase